MPPHTEHRSLRADSQRHGQASCRSPVPDSQPLSKKSILKCGSRKPETRDFGLRPPHTNGCESRSRKFLGSSSSHANGDENGSCTRRSPDLVAKPGSPEDWPSPSTEPVGAVKRKVRNDDSAASYSSVVKREPKITALESKCADLHISSLPKSKSIRREKVPEISVPSASRSLPIELIQIILGRVPWLKVIRLQGELGKSLKDSIYQPPFLRCRPSAEAEYRPIFFTTDDEDDLHWSGFNTETRVWESIPSLNFAKDTVLPSPDKTLFKDYLIAGDGGILCIIVGNPAGGAEVVVCNPLTKQAKALPPMKHARHPVLMHFKRDADSGHYTIVVAGSAAVGTEDLSLKTEEYDSRTGEWACPEGSDMPGPHFGLNEYQNGVLYTDPTTGRELLLCVAILNTRGRGVLAYDLKRKKWEAGPSNYQIPLVSNDSYLGSLATTQLVTCGDAVFVFSEQECGREVFFLIHKLNLDFVAGSPWEQILCRKRPGGRGLLVYPEFTCVAVSDHELGIFNGVELTMEIIDLDKPTAAVAPPPAPPVSTRNKFYSLNPIGFAYSPSFTHDVCPLRVRSSVSVTNYDISEGLRSPSHAYEIKRDPRWDHLTSSPRSSPGNQSQFPAISPDLVNLCIRPSRAEA